MFTGIIEETGTVEKIERARDSIALQVRAHKTGRGLKIGGSLAVNGCCLTATKIRPGGKSSLIQFDLLDETWRRTNFQFLKTSSLVNLERPLSAGDEFGGHFVTGHIDGTGKILRWEKSGSDHVLETGAPENVMRYIIEKGSIAIDGISLTVAGLTKKSFRVWIIPHTFEVTNLRERKPGDAVNLEADMLGKYVEKFTRKR
ncbi:MAG TPA: riboflavin synthase [Alphaproteobacteria bacterium]|nr:riboflavin synthase [Alphaproteobacteria bacterium]